MWHPRVGRKVRPHHLRNAIIVPEARAVSLRAGVEVSTRATAEVAFVCLARQESFDRRLRGSLEPSNYPTQLISFSFSMLFEQNTSHRPRLSVHFSPKSVCFVEVGVPRDGRLINHRCYLCHRVPAFCARIRYHGASKKPKEAPSSIVGYDASFSRFIQ